MKALTRLCLYTSSSEPCYLPMQEVLNLMFWQFLNDGITWTVSLYQLCATITGADPVFHMYLYKGVAVSLFWFYLIFLKYPIKWNNLVSLRPNYFIFIGYLKTGWGSREPPLDPPLDYKHNSIVMRTQRLCYTPGPSSVYSMPQSNKFINHFSILSEMAYCKAGLAPVMLYTRISFKNTLYYLS